VNKLRLLDIALLVVAALLGWQLRKEWQDAHTRDLVLLHGGLPPAKVPGVAPLDKVEPLSAATYLEIAVKDLFSPDRNPNIAVEPPPPPPPEKPPPPFPVAHGVMLWDGAPPTIVLSEKSNGTQKGYHPGDSIGQWKLVAIDNSYVDFEWDGKQFKKRIDELIDRTPIAAASQPAAASKAAGPKPAATQSLGSSPAKSGPGSDVGGGQKGCVAGDNTPDGAVVDGMKKVLIATPFGNSCHWETAK
jgi:hypothetical protein